MPGQQKTELITAEQIRAEIEAEEKRHAERMAEKRATLAMVEALEKKGFRIEPPSAAPKPPADKAPELWRKPTWGSVVPDILSRAERGLSPTEIIQAAKEMGVLDLLVGRKGLYNNLYILGEAGKVIKHQGYYYWKPLFEKLMAEAGGKLPKLKRHWGGNPLRVFITEALKPHPEGLTEDQITDAIREMPNCPSMVMTYRYYTGKALAPMVARGEVVKDGDLYKLGHKKANGRARQRPAIQVSQPSVEGPRRTSGKLVGKGGLPH
jgi:hypothetical protein